MTAYCALMIMNVANYNELLKNRLPYSSFLSKETKYLIRYS
jgi:hypothetical protein